MSQMQSMQESVAPVPATQNEQDGVTLTFPSLLEDAMTSIDGYDETKSQDLVESISSKQRKKYRKTLTSVLKDGLGVNVYLRGNLLCYDKETAFVEVRDLFNCTNPKGKRLFGRLTFDQFLALCHEEENEGEVVFLKEEDDVWFIRATHGFSAKTIEDISLDVLYERIQDPSELSLAFIEMPKQEFEMYQMIGEVIPIHSQKWQEWELQKIDKWKQNNQSSEVVWDDLSKIEKYAKLGITMSLYSVHKLFVHGHQRIYYDSEWNYDTNNVWLKIDIAQCMSQGVDVYKTPNDVLVFSHLPLNSIDVVHPIQIAFDAMVSAISQGKVDTIDYMVDSHLNVGLYNHKVNINIRDEEEEEKDSSA